MWLVAAGKWLETGRWPWAGTRRPSRPRRVKLGIGGDPSNRRYRSSRKRPKRRGRDQNRPLGGNARGALKIIVALLWSHSQSGDLGIVRRRTHIDVLCEFTPRGIYLEREENSHIRRVERAANDPHIQNESFLSASTSPHAIRYFYKLFQNIA